MSNNKKKNINHLFVNYNKDFKLPEFSNSKMDLKIERVNNDTYLKVFQNNLFPSPVMPENKSSMTNQLNYEFDKEEYNFSAGIEIYEDLGERDSDKYQYVLPTYNYSKQLNIENLNGGINFSSSGENSLKDTNNLRTSITNDIGYNSINYYTNLGIKIF